MGRLTTFTESLTESESRAGLRAVSRVLCLAGEQAYRHDDEKLAEVLSTARQLPELIAEPDEFRARFRPTLQRLVACHREFASVLSEFDRSTGTRRCPVEDDMWVDCGGDG